MNPHRQNVRVQDLAVRTDSACSSTIQYLGHKLELSIEHEHTPNTPPLRRLIESTNDIIPPQFELAQSHNSMQLDQTVDRYTMWYSLDPIGHNHLRVLYKWHIITSQSGERTISNSKYKMDTYRIPNILGIRTTRHMYGTKHLDYC